MTKAFHLLAVLALATAPIVHGADTPAAIAADYRAKATTALSRVNDTLEKATIPLIAALVKAGDTEGADLLKEQLKAKIAGDPVAKPQISAAALFKSYDAARARALEPAQQTAVKRIDAVLASSEGKKLDVVSELGKVRAEVEAGKAEPVVAVSPSRGFLKKNNIPKKWGYYMSNAYEKRYGTLHLNEDGTVSIEAASPTTGTWVTTADPSILAFDLKNAANVPEKTEFLIKGNEAVLERVSGRRYLKAD